MMPNQVFEKHVWAEIDLDALRQNFRTVKQRAGELPLCAVVKADSYGHGAVQCARVFAEEGAAWLACSCLAEALQLRQAGLTLPILILGHVYASCAADLIRNHITVACYSLEQAEALSKAACAAGGRVQVHLKADTGMGRIGFALRTDFEKAVREMAHACQLPGLAMTGLFQHFAVADETDEADVAYTAEQLMLIPREKAQTLGVNAEEIRRFREISEKMYLPYDEELGVFVQHDTFLDKDLMPADALSPADRPLNQKWSWDRILRSCFIKQADVLQGLYFLEPLYDKETIRRNFDFYEPMTVHESSLSPWQAGEGAGAVPPHGAPRSG